MCFFVLSYCPLSTALQTRLISSLACCLAGLTRVASLIDHVFFFRQSFISLFCFSFTLCLFCPCSFLPFSHSTSPPPSLSLSLSFVPSPHCLSQVTNVLTEKCLYRCRMPQGRRGCKDLFMIPSPSLLPSPSFSSPPPLLSLLPSYLLFIKREAFLPLCSGLFGVKLHILSGV